MRVRLSAVYIEDGQPQVDRLGMVVSLTKERSVSDEECFGVLIDEGDRFPFTGKPDKSDFVLDYGEYGEGEVVTRVNIVGKKLKVGDLFTRSDHFRGDAEVHEYTYRIEYVGSAAMTWWRSAVLLRVRAERRLGEILAAKNCQAWAPEGSNPPGDAKQSSSYSTARPVPPSIRPSIAPLRVWSLTSEVMRLGDSGLACIKSQVGRLRAPVLGVSYFAPEAFPGDETARFIWKGLRCESVRSM